MILKFKLFIWKALYRIPTRKAGIPNGDDESRARTKTYDDQNTTNWDGYNFIGDAIVSAVA